MGSHYFEYITFILWRILFLFLKITIIVIFNFSGAYNNHDSCPIRHILKKPNLMDQLLDVHRRSNQNLQRHPAPRGGT